MQSTLSSAAYASASSGNAADNGTTTEPSISPSTSARPSTAAGSKRKRVVLVKERNELPKEDAYETTFLAAGYVVTFLPALEFVFTRAEALQAVLSRPAAYSGLVATSPRGCLAASIAFKALSSTLSPDSFSALLTQWTAVPFYTVGEASAALLTSAFPLTATAVGGNAAALARFIVEQRRVDRTDGLPKPLLVLSGQLRREELFDGLRAGGVVYEEMEVYETQRRPGLTEDVRRLMEEGVEGDTGQERWMVFFSPSGVEAVHEGVGSGVDHGERMRRWRIAALGNTSAAAVRKVGWQCCAVAAVPSPAALLDAMDAPFNVNSHVTR